MPFGLENVHRQQDVVVTAATTGSIVIQPQVALPLEIANEVWAIKFLPGWSVALENGQYYLQCPEQSDPLAFAERIAIGLEGKGMRVKRVSKKLSNSFRPRTCQSFILA